MKSFRGFLGGRRKAVLVMLQITLTFDESQEQVVREAISNPHVTPQMWIENKLETVLKGQRAANLKAGLREDAKACKLAVARGAYNSVEDYVIRNLIEDKVTELGGLGAFYNLICDAKVRGVGHISETKIHTPAKVVIVPKSEVSTK
jgi:hypothetical protein